MIKATIRQVLKSALLIVLSRSALAYCPDDIQSLIHSDPIYKKTLELCQKAKKGDSRFAYYRSPLALSVFKVGTEEGAKAASFNPDTILVYYFDDGISQPFVNLTRDPSFRLAVMDCFPHDPDRQVGFYNRLLLLDEFGTGAGVFEKAAPYGAAFLAVWYVLPLLTERVAQFSGILTGLYMGFGSARDLDDTPEALAIEGAQSGATRAGIGRYLDRRITEPPAVLVAKGLIKLNQDAEALRAKLSGMSPSNPEFQADGDSLKRTEELIRDSRLFLDQNH